MVVACALFLYAAFARSWWSLGEAGFGLLGIHATDPDGSGGNLDYSALLASNSAAHDAEEMRSFMWAGRVAFGAILLAALAAGAAFLRVVMGQGPTKYIWATLASIAATIPSVAFIAKFLDEPTVKALVSYGTAFYLFWTAVVLAVAGEALVHHAHGTHVPRAHVTHAHTTSASTQPAAQAVDPMYAPCPACPQCRAPTILVAEFGRYFCSRCSLYL